MAYGTLKADVIQSDTANVPPQFNGGNGVQVGTLCRAWVNFNGTGTVAIRASFNVSSITDNGTGDYTVNFTNAMPDANYGVVANANTTTQFANIISLATTGARISSSYPYDGAKYDSSTITVAVFR